MLKLLSTSFKSDEETLRLDLDLDKGFKEDTRNDQYTHDKLLFLLSYIINSRNFQYSATDKKSIANILNALEILHKGKTFRSFYDVYFTFPSNSPTQSKYDVLSSMMGYLLGSSVQLENEHLLHEVLSDVVKNKIFPEKVLCLFGKVLDKYKCYEIISDLKLSMELKTFIDLKENLSSSEEIKRIYFYILNYIPSVDNYKTKLDVEKFSTLKKETEVISMLNSRNFKGLNEFKWKENFDSTYGNGAGNKFFCNAKIRLIHSIIVEKCKEKTEIPFDFLVNNHNILIEDIEDALFEGDKLQLFKLHVDYERNVIKVKYIRKFTYTNEDVVAMKRSVTGLREKLKLFAKRLNDLTA